MVQPYEGEPRASNEDLNEEKKLLLLNVCECCVCVMISTAKSMLGIGSFVRFCCHNILFLRTECDEGSPWSVLQSCVVVE